MRIASVGQRFVGEARAVVVLVVVVAAGGGGVAAYGADGDGPHDEAGGCECSGCEAVERASVFWVFVPFVSDRFAAAADEMGGG